MPLFKKVAIVGTGLIGGSVALAIKKKHLCNEIIGVSRHRKSLALAKNKGAIDRGSLNLEVIKEADLVVLATPVSVIISEAKKISKIVSKDCIVTDVGSTKGEVSNKLEKLFPNYIGSHPLTGSEKRGIINAGPGIFRGSLCILTPTPNSKPKALAKIKIFWQRLGARVAVLTPEKHDTILALVSHLPHTVAFSLIGSVPGQYLRFASTGLRDTTRIAASDSEIWTDIFLSNRRNIIKAISLFQENLSRLKSAVAKKDKKILSSILKQAKEKRDRLNQQ